MLRVLLTGFGPFPGVAENPSAWLAEALAARSSSLDCELRALVLPAEWGAVTALTPRLYEKLQPHVMIHFGVSQRATAFRIERSAHNRILPRADARGALPERRAIAQEGSRRLDTSLPTRALGAYLRAEGLAASASPSCGRYLCNFLYYRSLDWAARQADPPLVLFVHMPPRAAQDGPLDDATLLNGAEATLRFVLAFAGSQRAPSLTGAAVADHEAGLRVREWN
ncbi:MAG: hypothetical protein ACREDO_13215 [Methyloceanibacter sp.]